ncbi:MAG: class I SAM-dependent methyltransferase [Dehalococcoidia bacterium]
MNPHDHHDWHSEEYVREWVTRSQPEDQARLQRFQLMADLVPHPKDAPISVLDVGSGYGPLANLMLRAFPQARLTAQDYSDPMLAYARRLLAPHRGRATFVKADLFSSDWVALVGGPFDAVVSSIAIHNLRSASRIREVYREIYRAVKDGGCFLNLDLVNAPAPELQRRYWEIMMSRRAARGPSEEPQQGAAEALARQLEADGEEETRLPFPATVDDQLAWLGEAGFRQVDCFWKELGLALVGGYK